MKIFITGIAGFIGSSLAKDFQMKSYYVRGLDNLSTGREENLSSGIQWEKLDIREAHALDALREPFDIVLHLAAQSSGEKSFEMPIYDMETNVKGSYYVYEFARECKAKLLINFSSMAVYGDVRESTPIREERPPCPISPYANSKLAAENLLSMLSKRDHVPVVNVRLFNAYGPGQNLRDKKQGMISIFLAYLLSEPEIIVRGALDRVRDFIYIDDIVRAVNKIIENNKGFTDCYNLCTSEFYSVKQVLEILMMLSGIEKPIAQRANTPGDLRGFAGSYQKLNKDFAWEPSISLKEGVGKMLRHYMK